ncbi:MAG: hypothetical protein AAGJ18_10370, partial [Bacteroidota bacterium]
MIKITDKETFALYRLPNEASHFLVKQENSAYQLLDEDTFDKSGFIFYPFTRSSGKPSVFIKCEEVVPNAQLEFYSTHSKQVDSIDKST